MHGKGYADGYMVAEMRYQRMPVLYALRDCPFCGDEINNLTKAGNRMNPARYAEQLACDNPECRDRLRLKKQADKSKDYKKYKQHPNYHNPDFLIGVRT